MVVGSEGGLSNDSQDLDISKIISTNHGEQLRGVPSRLALFGLASRSASKCERAVPVRPETCGQSREYQEE